MIHDCTVAWFNYCLSTHAVTALYVRKEEEKVYHALHLDSLTVHDFKLQVGLMMFKDYLYIHYDSVWCSVHCIYT